MHLVLSENQYEEMHRVIEDGIENRLQVRMTLFVIYENRVIMGHPYIENGRLKLNTEDGIEIVPLEN